MLWASLHFLPKCGEPSPTPLQHGSFEETCREHPLDLVHNPRRSTKRSLGLAHLHRTKPNYVGCLGPLNDLYAF